MTNKKVLSKIVGIRRKKQKSAYDDGVSEPDHPETS